MDTCGDGVLIRTPGIKNFEAEFENGIEISEDVAITSTLTGKDGFNRLETLAQAAIYKDGDKTGIAVNSKLMGRYIRLKATKDGETVFSGQYINPDFQCCDSEKDPNENWILTALTIAVVILVFTDYEKETVKEDGKVTKETTTVSVGNGGSGGGSIVFNDRDGNEFEADHLYISSSFEYPKGKDVKYVHDPHSYQLSFCNIDDVTIKNEEYDG